MGKAPRKSLKDQNRPQLWAIIAANAVAFYCVAQWDSISTAGIESLFKHAANLLPVGLTIILTTVANALISSDNKARLVFLRWKHALPGHRAFSKYAMPLRSCSPRSWRSSRLPRSFRVLSAITTSQKIETQNARRPRACAKNGSPVHDREKSGLRQRLCASIGLALSLVLLLS